LVECRAASLFIQLVPGNSAMEAMELLSFFDLQAWYSTASYEFNQYFKKIGKVEVLTLGSLVLAAGLICMRGFQIR